ncbi:hypothetical protein [Paraburkholderia xenovorans]|jgi:hypothetical protein|uniref:hypothetical protein n=1 Tax=Paraburkholderia xenovorans TaxID=36873 RepID=UPI0003240272|nr:hypothetical protein [Paraburkholderia xenovorans]
MRISATRRSICADGLGPSIGAAVHAGYCSEEKTSERFNQTWRVACVLTDMLAIAQSPECRTAGLVELEELVERLRLRLT